MKHTGLLAADGQTPLREAVFRAGGAGFGDQLKGWSPPSQSVDAAFLPVRKLANARTDDVVRNNGIAANGIQLHKDHIVGSEFRLSYKPNWRLLGIKPDKGFVQDVEAIFRDIAEDPGCFIDAERRRTFTMMMRESVETHAMTGDIMAKPEWINDRHSPFATAIRMVSPRKVTNPNHGMDKPDRRGGVELNRHGAAVAYYVEEGADNFGMSRTWRRVEKTNPSGRTGFIHIFEPCEGGQTRGVNRFMSSLEQLKMLDTLQHTTLQRAVVNAMYAASIESELGTNEAMEYIFGASRDGAIEKMLMTYGDYYAANEIKFNGVKLPHLMPGDKLNLHTAGNADNGFSALEQSILRYIAAGWVWITLSCRGTIRRCLTAPFAPLITIHGVITWVAEKSSPTVSPARSSHSFSKKCCCVVTSHCLAMHVLPFTNVATHGPKATGSALADWPLTV
ncbi:phage portal protein [Vibrio fluvialis]|uniref:phage portal protein n=1 Tax=Vibrio fluvialis TaxID=676 RepID=UPI001EE9DD01|nr:phage portal protein [Vibrio fluvialis]